MKFYENFNNYYEKLEEGYLFEGITAVRNQFPNISDTDFYNILEIDPTYNKEKDSVGKYSKWLLTQFQKGNITSDINQEVYSKNSDFDYQLKEVIKNFNDYKNDKTKKLKSTDINSYKNPQDLLDSCLNVEDVELSKRQKLRQMHHSKDYEHYDIDDRWEVFVPNSWEADVKLGAGTNWCTADSRDPWPFNKYTNNGEFKLYILRDKNSGERYQFLFENDTFMDEEDSPIDIVKLMNSSNKLCNFFENLGLYKDWSNEVFLYDGIKEVPKHVVNVKVADNVDEIKFAAFDFCQALQSIDLKNVTEIGVGAFRGCTSLQSIDLKNITEIGDGAFDNCESLQSIELPNVTKLGDAFEWCMSLQSIKLPKVLKIEDETFFGCIGLQSIELPNVTEIGDKSFYRCNSLQSITCPNVKKIGEVSFEYCKSLQSIKLPNDCTYYENSFEENTKVIGGKLINYN